MIAVDESSGKCTFKFRAGAAKQVFLAGDFNNWNEKSHPMVKMGDVWELTLQLPSGEYRFKYLVDGFWHNDREAHRYVPNVWGSDDSVVIVPESASGIKQ
jgi:1,4-alpha-glucan branching enzyme